MVKQGCDRTSLGNHGCFIAAGRAGKKQVQDQEITSQPEQRHQSNKGRGWLHLCCSFSFSAGGSRAEMRVQTLPLQFGFGPPCRTSESLQEITVIVIPYPPPPHSHCSLSCSAGTLGRGRLGWEMRCPQASPCAMPAPAMDRGRATAACPHAMLPVFTGAAGHCPGAASRPLLTSRSGCCRVCSLAPMQATELFTEESGRGEMQLWIEFCPGKEAHGCQD